MHPYIWFWGVVCLCSHPSVCQHGLFIPKPAFSFLVAARKDTSIQLEEATENTAFFLSFQRTNSLAEKIPEAIWSETEMGPEVTGSVSIPEFC